MTMTMGPPPARIPNTSAATTESSSEPEPETKISTDPPSSSTEHEQNPPQSKSSSSGAPPYNIPEWSGPPSHNYFLEVLKDGSIIDQFNICEKGAYMFGRVDLCDFVLEHPSISRFHTVLQFKRNGDAYLYDLGSTHGTFINKTQVEKRIYVELHVGDVIRFGQSSRLYIFQGPPDLMPPETDLKILRSAKMQQEMLDREASIERARLEASFGDGISWGMGEDAIEEAEDDGDEVTWKTYKGQLTEKQEKTRDKIIKRIEKIAHMRKEIDAIRAKDIAQGGLTQGQQTQIARNEQRITQIMEELENLEETLNDSIRESIGARGGRISHGNRKRTTEEEDFLSDDDDFYDRTKKPSMQKSVDNQSVETADTLLDKRDAIVKEMEDKKELLALEKNKVPSETAVEAEAGDTLDAYMSGLSSQLVVDKTVQLEKELSALQSELDRVFFLLKIADPSGEIAKIRDSKVLEQKPLETESPASTNKKLSPVQPKGKNGLGKPTNVCMQKESSADAKMESSNTQETDKTVIEVSEGKPAVYTAVKPQWLGAVDKEVKEAQQKEVLRIDGSDQFVDYKDRQKMLSKVDIPQTNVDSEIESAAPGLILRKRKEAERAEAINNEAPEQVMPSYMGTELMAEDAVALLLKHKKGCRTEDEEGINGSQQMLDRGKPGTDKRPKKMLGPEKPSFLNRNSDYESWVPPEGQSGDGRTSLNDRYGY